ncbi:pG1340L [African swine fever virus]|uniref:PG1340L n=1 Tax=African swine fever virus TaxID=10497 RepID=A0A894KTZ4_ASF|nr:pG1340L [African swine fever virus]
MQLIFYTNNFLRPRYILYVIYIAQSCYKYSTMFYGIYNIRRENVYIFFKVVYRNAYAFFFALRLVYGRILAGGIYIITTTVDGFNIFIQFNARRQKFFMVLSYLIIRVRLEGGKKGVLKVTNVFLQNLYSMFRIRGFQNMFYTMYVVYIYKVCQLCVQLGVRGYFLEIGFLQKIFNVFAGCVALQSIQDVKKLNQQKLIQMVIIQSFVGLILLWIWFLQGIYNGLVYIPTINTQCCDGKLFQRSGKSLGWSVLQVYPSFSLCKKAHKFFFYILQHRCGYDFVLFILFVAKGIIFPGFFKACNLGGPQIKVDGNVVMYVRCYSYTKIYTAISVCIDMYSISKVMPVVMFFTNRVPGNVFHVMDIPPVILTHILAHTLDVLHHRVIFGTNILGLTVFQKSFLLGVGHWVHPFVRVKDIGYLLRWATNFLYCAGGHLKLEVPLFIFTKDTVQVVPYGNKVQKDVLPCGVPLQQLVFLFNKGLYDMVCQLRAAGKHVAGPIPQNILLRCIGRLCNFNGKGLGGKIQNSSKGIQKPGIAISKHGLLHPHNAKNVGLFYCIYKQFICYLVGYKGNPVHRYFFSIRQGMSRCLCITILQVLFYKRVLGVAGIVIIQPLCAQQGLRLLAARQTVFYGVAAFYYAYMWVLRMRAAILRRYPLRAIPILYYLLALGWRHGLHLGLCVYVGWPWVLAYDGVYRCLRVVLAQVIQVGVLFLQRTYLRGSLSLLFIVQLREFVIQNFIRPGVQVIYKHKYVYPKILILFLGIVIHFYFVICIPMVHANVAAAVHCFPPGRNICVKEVRIRVLEQRNIVVHFAPRTGGNIVHPFDFVGIIRIYPLFIYKIVHSGLLEAPHGNIPCLLVFPPTTFVLGISLATKRIRPKGGHRHGAVTNLDVLVGGKGQTPSTGKRSRPHIIICMYITVYAIIYGTHHGVTVVALVFCPIAFDTVLPVVLYGTNTGLFIVTAYYNVGGYTECFIAVFFRLRGSYVVFGNHGGTCFAIQEHHQLWNIGSTRKKVENVAHIILYIYEGRNFIHCRGVGQRAACYSIPLVLGNVLLCSGIRTVYYFLLYEKPLFMAGQGWRKSRILFFHLYGRLYQYFTGIGGKKRPILHIMAVLQYVKLVLILYGNGDLAPHGGHYRVVVCHKDVLYVFYVLEAVERFHIQLIFLSFHTCIDVQPTHLLQLLFVLANVYRHPATAQQYAIRHLQRVVLQKENVLSIWGDPCGNVYFFPNVFTSVFRENTILAIHRLNFWHHHVCLLAIILHKKFFKLIYIVAISAHHVLGKLFLPILAVQILYNFFVLTGSLQVFAAGLYHVCRNGSQKNIRLRVLIFRRIIQSISYRICYKVILEI